MQVNAQVVIRGKLVTGLGIHSFLDDPVDAREDRAFAEHLLKAFEQRAQARFRHCWNEVVEHRALAKQRVGAALAGVGFEMAIITQSLPGGAEDGQ